MESKKFFKWAGIILLAGLTFILIFYFVLDNYQEPLPMDKEARREAPGKFIQLSHGMTHYRLIGPETGKTVVLIHGGMVSGMYAWEKNYRFLVDQGFRVLMYDLYGRGYSDRVEQEYTPQLLFSQFNELLDSLKIKAPISIAGLSLGSMVAIEYSRQHPEMVDELILLSPAARGKFPMHPALKVPLLSDLLLAVYWFPRTVNNQMQEFHQPENHPEYVERLKEMMRYEGYKASNYSTWVNTLTYNMENEIAEIGKHGIPVVLILGKSDPYVTIDEAATYQELIPQLKIYNLEKAGHIVNYERPDTVNMLMSHFFSDHRDQ